MYIVYWRPRHYNKVLTYLLTKKLPFWGIRTAIKSKYDHAYKTAYLKCTLNLNSNSKNEAFSLSRNRENEGQRWYLRALLSRTKSHNGTETETPSLALGTCEFQQSYFLDQLNVWINRKLVSREVRKLLFSAVKKTKRGNYNVKDQKRG